MTVTVAGLAGVTNIKRGLKTLLLGEPFRTALDEVQELFADGLPMAALIDVKRAELKTLATLPMAELLAVRSIKLSDSPWSQSYEHILALRFYVGGDDEELITDQVERYILAARRLFTVDPGNEVQLFPYIGGSISPEAEDYDPTVRMKESEATLVKAGTLELIVRTTT